MRFYLGMRILLPGLFLAGCAGSTPQAEEVPAEASATATVEQTSAIIWFPATQTPLPIVTPTSLPARNLRPGVGEEIFSDQFTTESDWQLARDDNGSIAYGNNELTLAIRKPKILLASLNRALLLSDFYLEVTANPSLCRAMDSYGLLLRASSNNDAYRLLFSCSGQIRLERLMGGRVTVLQDWTYSGQVPPGSPAVLRIGVWALRSELRFFVNDFYQFSVLDTVFRTGGLGFFARSAGENALTVSFSNLAVYELNPDEIPPTETPTPTASHTPTLTRIALRQTYQPK